MEKSEATKYKKFYQESCTLLSFVSPRQNIDVLLIRYVSLLSQDNVMNNENAKAMLDHIIMDLLSNQFTFIQKDLDNSGLHYNEDNNKDEPLFDHLAREKFAVMDFIFAEGKSLEIRVIKGEAIEALSSILSILKPSKKLLIMNTTL